MPNETDPSRERQISSDRDAIREWARDHDAVPVRESTADAERDRLRIVPEHELRDSDDRVEWETFFDELDEGDQVVVYHGETAEDPLEVTGQRDLVGRVDDDELEERLMEGETVTSEITETRVVESVVVEELTIESELVGTEQVEGRVVEAELVDLACPSCTLQEESDADASDWFDTERYLDAVGDVGTMAATSTDADGTTRRTGGTDATGTETDAARSDTDTTRTEADTAGTETDPTRTETDAEMRTDATPTETEPTHTDTEARRETEDRTDTGARSETDAARSDTADVGADATEDRTTAPGEHTATVTDRTEEPGDRTRDAGTTDVDATDDDHTRTTGARRGSLDETEFPYRAELEVEETWAVTREVIEQYVVESRVTDKAVTEADSIEDYDLDAAELHRSILEQELFETERPSDEVLAHYDVESELSDPDRIETTFTNERRVQDRIVDRKRLDASIAGGEYTGMDLVESRIVDLPGAAESDAAGPMDETATDETATAGTTGEADAAPTPITDDLVGNTVRNASGDEIGMVSDVDESTDELFVDVQPGITERIMATLGWSDADSQDYSLGADAVRRIDDDEVWLKGREEIEDTTGDRA